MSEKICQYSLFLLSLLVSLRPSDQAPTGLRKHHVGILHTGSCTRLSLPGTLDQPLHPEILLGFQNNVRGSLSTWVSIPPYYSALNEVECPTVYSDFTPTYVHSPC